MSYDEDYLSGDPRMTAEERSARNAEYRVLAEYNAAAINRRRIQFWNAQIASFYKPYKNARLILICLALLIVAVCIVIAIACSVPS